MQRYRVEKGGNERYERRICKELLYEIVYRRLRPEEFSECLELALKHGRRKVSKYLKSKKEALAPVRRTGKTSRRWGKILVRLINVLNSSEVIDVREGRPPN